MECRLIWPRKRHVNINHEAAKEMKQFPIDGDCKQLLDETHAKHDQLQQHWSVYQNLREQLENAAKTAGKIVYENVMKDY